MSAEQLGTVASAVEANQQVVQAAELNAAQLQQTQGQEQAAQWNFPADAPAAERPAAVGMTTETSPGVFGAGWDYNKTGGPAAGPAEANAPVATTEAPAAAKPDALDASIAAFDKGVAENFPITVEAEQAKRGKLRRLGSKIVGLVRNPSTKN